MQIRYAQAHAAEHAGAAHMPDVRVIAPGRTYRVDNDATHSPMFHQVEGLWLGENVSFRDLKAVYLDFMQAFFETSDAEAALSPELLPVHRAERRDRPRCSTTARSPDAGSRSRDRARCIRRSSATWASIPSACIGFAFGSGIDRLAMLRYGIDDLRLFFDGDLRFLRQFA